jgi:hypothetical protein
VELWNPDTYDGHVTALEKEGVSIRSLGDLMAELARQHIQAVS